MSSCSWAITGKELDPWTYEWDESINPKEPLVYAIQPVADGLDITCAGEDYAGALAKHVSKLPYQSTRIVSTYKFRFGTNIDYGQVVEFDRKFTDDEGWTYDGSTQWNIEKGWEFQIGDPWIDTGLFGQFLVDEWNTVEVVQILDYVAHTLTFESVSVNGVLLGHLTQPPIPARQVGWDRSQIVTQAQLCTAYRKGAYNVRFAGIGDSGGV